MNEIILHIFGNYTMVQILSFTWFFVIGYLIYGLNETTSRDVNSLATPKKWSWKFWFQDNWRRYLITFLSTYIMFRFYVELSGQNFTDFEALMMGLIGDGIGATMKKRVSQISANREQLMKLHVEQENLS